MSYYESKDTKHFTMENTEGYSQKELDLHNECFSKYLLFKGIETWDEDWKEHLYKGCTEEYFNKYMC